MSGASPGVIGARYDLEREIGGGSTAVVWKGRVRDSGAPVAVKMFRPELAADRELVGRFVAERSILMAVDQLNLVRVRDLVAAGDVLALVSDFVDGPSLRQLLGRGPIEATESARIAGHVAAGLCALHEADIVHCDVKPENILIGDGQAKLADLGLAWLVRTSCSKDRQPAARPLLGTPGYLAPELALGAAPAAPADIYALGVVLYEMLTGRTPGVVDADRPGMRRMPGAAERGAIPDVPRDLWRIVGCCLRSEPAARPTADALAGLLLVGGHLHPNLSPERALLSRGIRVNGSFSQRNGARASSVRTKAGDPTHGDDAERPTIHHTALAPAADVTPAVNFPIRRILVAPVVAAAIGCLAVVGLGIVSSHAPRSSGAPPPAGAAAIGWGEPSNAGERYQAPTGWLCRAPAVFAVGASIVEVQPCLVVDRTTVRATVRNGVAVGARPGLDTLRVTLRLVDAGASMPPLAEQSCEVASSASATCPEISVAAVPGTAYRAVVAVATAGRLSRSFAKASTLTTPIVQNSPAQDRHSTHMN